MAEIRVPPNFQLMITPRTLELQTSFWARWNCLELKFMKRDEKNELSTKKKQNFLKISFFAPRSIRLNFLVSPRFQKLITLCWTDEIGSFSQSPKI